jgi:hypothetical protein
MVDHLLQFPREVYRRLALRWALTQLRRLGPEEHPRRQVLSALRCGWGNLDYAAGLAYLDAIARHVAESRGPILECGSGASTLLLGLLASRRNLHVWTLEHHPRWHAFVAERLRAHAIPGVTLCQVSLRSYGDFSWYDPPLDQMPTAFSLVICDGPPNKTPGGRYGLIPVMRDRLAPEWRILLDDANSAKRTGTLDRWAAEPGVTITRHDMADGAFLLVTRRAPGH